MSREREREGERYEGGVRQRCFLLSRYGPTQFSDLEDHEYRAGYLGLNTGLEPKPEFGTEFLLTEPAMLTEDNLGKLPELFDWYSNLLHCFIQKNLTRLLKQADLQRSHPG